MACATQRPEEPPNVGLEAPVAAVIPEELEIHGDVRIDDYYWLRDPEDPAVIAYLEAENEYTEAVMAHTDELQEQLYQEITGRIKQDDDSVPYKKGDYFYYYRFEKGDDYPIYCRKRGSLDSQEEIMIDANRLATGHEFFTMWAFEVSPDGKTVAYATDTVGRRLNTLRFRDLETGQDLPDVIDNVTSNGEWANDNKTFFYTKQDPETLRWHQVYKHVLGSDPGDDELIYEEADEEFNISLYKTKSDRYLVIGSQQTLSSEMWVLEADQPDGDFRVIQPREPDHEYWVDHYGDDFYLRTNWEAKNFRFMKTPVGRTGKENWEEVIPHRDDVLFEDAEIFKDYLVAMERKDGLIQMRIVPWDGSEEHYLDFGEPTYYAEASDNYEFDTSTLRFVYTSLTTPMSTIDYDMASGEKTLLKEEEVLGGFDKADYRTERIWASARDGARVPISLVYRKDLFRHDGSNPLLLYGYGSYGAVIDPYFSSARVSLLDRGFVYAIPHIRGSATLGRQWYEDGKLLNKMNTFTDFIDCAQYLVDEDYTRPQVLFANGGSAGGLLMGVVTNLAPDLFRGVISHVPFVDVVTTMLDPDIPLTTSEYDEWGDPNEKQYYDYMLAYSPYDNIEAKDYPHLLVTTGLHDSQVQFWEPAKYVAKMRALKTDDNRLLLKTNMDAGHGGASGRLTRHQETALDYAFLLDLAGIEE